MKTTLSTSDAVRMLLNDEYANRSREGATALVEYLVQMEDIVRQQFLLLPLIVRFSRAANSRATDSQNESSPQRIFPNSSCETNDGSR